MKRIRIFVLTVVLSVACVSVAGTGIVLLYREAVGNEFRHLMAVATGYSQLIESVAEFDRVQSSDFPGGSAAATLSQVAKTFEAFKGFDETGEMTLARRAGNSIRFDLMSRAPANSPLLEVPFDGANAEPIRLRETPGTPEFEAEYRAAFEGTPNHPTQGKSAKAPTPAKPGTLRWLAQLYFGSAEFKRLERGHVRRRLIEKICEDSFDDIGDRVPHGDKPYNLMQDRHVRRIRDKHADRPEAANGHLKALRALFTWAREAGYVKSNPAAEVPYIRTGSEGFHTWTVEEVRQYEDHHPVGTAARLALAVLMFTGTRRCDAVRLGPQMEDKAGIWLRFTEVKGRNRAPKQREIPILPELRAIVDAKPSGHLAYIVTTFGKPFTANGFGNRFRKWCDEAGLPHCTAHGLRKAGATIAAERGATEHQLMAIFGWDSPKQAAIYTRKARRKRLAGNAMHLLVPEQEVNESVPLFPEAVTGGTIKAKKPLKNKDD